MGKSSLTSRERSRKTENVMRNGISDIGRQEAMRLLGISDSQMAKFVAGNKDDCKINVKSISDLLVGMGLKVVPANQRSCPKGSIPIPLSIAVGAWHNSQLGLDNLKEQLKKEGASFPDGDED